MATAPMKSISGEVIACARTERRFARNSRLAAWRKRTSSQNSMLKAFTMRLPVIVSCRMFWISASLSWPRRVVRRTSRPMRGSIPTAIGNKKQQHPGQLASQRHHHHNHAQQREELLQKIRQHRRRRVLHPLNVVDQRRKQRSRGVFLEERNRAAQDRLIQVVAHIGDHAEAGIIRQIRAGVIANALQQRRRRRRQTRSPTSHCESSAGPAPAASR